ncbi:MAG: secretin N-terminal domain-containing protein [Blastocatellia bacterium]
MLLSLVAIAALAQQNTPQTTNKESNYVDFTGFKGKILEVKNRDPRELVAILAPLGSGFKGASLQPNSEFKTITVRDFPENIAAIEEALKRLDVPLPVSAKPVNAPMQNAELRLHVLLASNGETVKADPLPADVQKVIKELQSTLNYKNYIPVTAIVHRTVLTSGASVGRVKGLAVVSNSLFDRAVTLPYELAFDGIFPELRNEDNGRIFIRNFSFDIGGGNDLNLTGNSRISSTLTLREGEQVVVGTSSLKDKGLILILSVKVIK